MRESSILLSLNYYKKVQISNCFYHLVQDSQGLKLHIQNVIKNKPPECKVFALVMIHCYKSIRKKCMNAII